MSSPLAFQEVKVREGALLGSTRLVSLLSGDGDWGSGSAVGLLGEQPPAKDATGLVPLDAFCTFSIFWWEECDTRVLDRGIGVDGISRCLSGGRRPVAGTGGRGERSRQRGKFGSVAWVTLLKWSGCALRASGRRTSASALDEAALGIGFSVDRANVEAVGLCPACQKATP